MTSNTKLSAIVPVGRRSQDIATLAEEYIQALDEIDKNFEIIFVVDGDRTAAVESLMPIIDRHAGVRIIKFTKTFGEATAIAAGYRHAVGTTILTLPAYYQIEASEIPKLVESLDGCDMVVAQRSPRARKSSFEVYRRKAFHWLIKVFSGESFSDLGCSARAIRREVLDEISLYGDQHLFLPLLASRQGFRVKEIAVSQSPKDWFEGRYSVRSYLHRALDIFSVIFLVRFTKKSLRFFGMVGSITFLFGAAVLFVLIVDRLFFGTALADRPALLVSSLLTVLGLQIFALGLLGELIIFTHARQIKEYTIEKIIN